MKLFLIVAVIGLTYAEECGHPAIPPKVDLNKIVGGEYAVPHSWPWQIALYAKMGPMFTHICGGSLIGEKLILTAAHCVYGSDNKPEQFKVKLGAHYKGVSAQKSLSELMMQQVADVESIAIHPNNDPTSNTFDFALLRLKAPVKYTKYVSPVCLPSANHTTGAAERAVVTGWGTLSSGAANTPYLLRQVVLPTVSNADCQKAYGSTPIDDSMLCAGYPEGGKDSCQGDSGGPFVQQINGRWEQTGVVSWGYGCAEPGFPGVYARVTSTLSWLQNALKSSK